MEVIDCWHKVFGGHKSDGLAGYVSGSLQLIARNQFIDITELMQLARIRR
jgi:hypothetical protein